MKIRIAEYKNGYGETYYRVQSRCCFIWETLDKGLGIAEFKTLEATQRFVEQSWVSPRKLKQRKYYSTILEMEI